MGVDPMCLCGFHVTRPVDEGLGDSEDQRVALKDVRSQSLNFRISDRKTSMRA